MVKSSIYQLKIDWNVPYQRTILVKIKTLTGKLWLCDNFSQMINSHEISWLGSKTLLLALLKTLIWPQVSLIVSHQNDILVIACILNQLSSVTTIWFVIWGITLPLVLQYMIFFGQKLISTRELIWCECRVKPKNLMNRVITLWKV